MPSSKELAWPSTARSLETSRTRHSQAVSMREPDLTPFVYRCAQVPTCREIQTKVKIRAIVMGRPRRNCLIRRRSSRSHEHKASDVPCKCTCGAIVRSPPCAVCNTAVSVTRMVQLPGHSPGCSRCVPSDVFPSSCRSVKPQLEACGSQNCVRLRALTKRDWSLRIIPLLGLDGAQALAVGVAWLGIFSFAPLLQPRRSSL